MPVDTSAHVSEIIVYPVKSLAGISLPSCAVEPKGLQHDRRWALVTLSGDILTAREHPSLLALQTEIVSDGIRVSAPAAQSVCIPFDIDRGHEQSLQIFGAAVSGIAVDRQLDLFFSDYLDEHCKLVRISDQTDRAVATRHGGIEGDVVGFADTCPLLLTNELSLADLNSRLISTEACAAIPMRQFRPNIVISGPAAFAEEAWSEVQIGQSAFNVAQLCKRCSLATINPDSATMHLRQEPLRTMSKFRPRFQGGVAFGIHLAIVRAGHGQNGQLTEIAINDNLITK